jgi:hypothetical protein
LFDQVKSLKNDQPALYQYAASFLISFLTVIIITYLIIVLFVAAILWCDNAATIVKMENGLAAFQNDCSISSNGLS